MDEDELTRLGEQVKAARLARKLSKEAVARIAEVSAITYKRVEDGQRVRDTSLMQVLEALELSQPAQAPTPPVQQDALAEVLERLTELQELVAAMIAESRPRVPRVTSNVPGEIRPIPDRSGSHR